MPRGDQVVTPSKVLEAEQDYQLRRGKLIDELTVKSSSADKINQMCETAGFKLLLDHMKQVDDKFREEWASLPDTEAQKLKLTASAHREILAWIRAVANTGDIAKRELIKLNNEVSEEMTPNRKGA
jgi:hypothetical protein